MRFKKTATGILTLMLVLMSCLASACAASCDAKALGSVSTNRTAPSKQTPSDTASMSSDCKGMTEGGDTQTAKSQTAIIVENTQCLHTACNHDEADIVTDTAVHFEHVYLVSPVFLTEVTNADLRQSSTPAYCSPPSSPLSRISALRI